MRPEKYKAMYCLERNKVCKFILILNESESESQSVVSDSLRPCGLYSSGILQARILEWVAFVRDLQSRKVREPSPATPSDQE